MKDYYKILGVSRSATADEIKAAYRNLALKYHPDRHPSNPLSHLAEEKFKEIQDAYDVLMSAYEGKQSSSSYNSSYDARKKRESWEEGHSENSNKESTESKPQQEQQSTGQNNKKKNTAKWFFICLAIIGIWAAMVSHTPSGPTAINTNLTAATKSSFSLNSQNVKTVLSSSMDPYDKQGFAEFMQDHPEYKGQENDPAVQRHFQNEYDTYKPSKGKVSNITGNRSVYYPTRSYFTMGSSKDDVLAVQGAPTSMIGNMWMYGYDSVTFDYSTGRVTSYSNSSGTLKIRF